MLAACLILTFLGRNVGPIALRAHKHVKTVKLKVLEPCMICDVEKTVLIGDPNLRFLPTLHPGTLLIKYTGRSVSREVFEIVIALVAV